MSAVPFLADALDEGRTVVVRPIRPDDAARLGRMFPRLSPTTVYRRFFTPVQRPVGWALRHLAEVDHGEREAIVALVDDEVIGVARYDRADRDGTRAEVAVIVEDAWQRRGVARFLLARLAALAAARGIDELTATVLAENRPALALARTLSPDARLEGTGVERELVIPLRPQPRGRVHASRIPASPPEGRRV